MTLDTETLYWLFSTIPQVLSGFIALSGVFLIFKIQELKKMQILQAKLFTHAAHNINPSKGFSKFHGIRSDLVDLQNLWKSESVGGMLEEINNLLTKQEFNRDDLKKYRNVFVKIHNLRKNLLILTKISIISGILAIFGSLSMLITVTQMNIFINNEASLKRRLAAVLS
ncbi:MAG: hypothetical protein ACLFM7_02985 [Bacteroidales bacterium]